MGSSIQRRDDARDHVGHRPVACRARGQEPRVQRPPAHAQALGEGASRELQALHRLPEDVLLLGHAALHIHNAHYYDLTDAHDAIYAMSTFPSVAAEARIIDPMETLPQGSADYV